MVRNKADRAVLEKSIVHIVDELQPSNILRYGSDEYGVTDYIKAKHIPIKYYEAKGRGQLKTRRKGGGEHGRSQ